MKRIEYCKKQLTESIGEKGSPVHLTFQEMCNFLPTYDEKKELKVFYQELVHEKKEALETVQ